MHVIKQSGTTLLANREAHSLGTGGKFCVWSACRKHNGNVLFVEPRNLGISLDTAKAHWHVAQGCHIEIVRNNVIF